MRNLLLGIGLLVTLGAAPARADEASHRGAVMELFQSMDMARLMNGGMEASLKAQIQANPALARYETQMRAFFAKYMSWDSLKDEFATMYMKSFTEAELKELVAFYKTSIGKKALRVMPLMMQQGAEVGTQRVQAHMAELMAILQAPPETQPAAPAGAAKKKPAK